MATSDGHRNASGSRSATSCAGAFRPKFSSAASSFVKAGLRAYEYQLQIVQNRGRVLTTSGSWETRTVSRPTDRESRSPKPSCLQKVARQLRAPRHARLGFHSRLTKVQTRFRRTVTFRLIWTSRTRCGGLVMKKLGECRYSASRAIGSSCI